MKATDGILQRHQVASLLALQCALRISGLLSIGMLSAVRKTLDTYLLCLQHGADYAQQSRVTDSPKKLVAGYADAMTDYTEKSWQDLRNNLQILLLTQDEALIWIVKIDRALLGR